MIIPVGLWIKYFEPAEEAFKLRLYNIHESLGVIVFVIVLIRLVNRYLNPPPPLPADTPAVIRLAAHVNHMALYALLVLMPIIGLSGDERVGFSAVGLRRAAVARAPRQERGNRQGALVPALVWCDHDHIAHRRASGRA